MGGVRTLLPFLGALIALAPFSDAQERRVSAGDFFDAAKPLHLQTDEDVAASEYLRRLLDDVGHRWISAMTGAGTNPIVRFVVGRDGRLSNVQLERSSGVFAIDQLAMKAVINSSPVERFPPSITIPQLTVHLTFTPRRFSTAYADAKIQTLNAVGLNHLTGTGGPKDPLRALKAFREAAEMGDTSAMNNLAFMYESGEGVRQDERAAAEWYTRAAELGSEIASLNLARFYESGRGVQQDTAAALRWYRSITGSTKPLLAREARSAVDRLSR
jgi:TonB family protein